MIPPIFGLVTVDYVVIAAYLLATLAMGVGISRGQKSDAEYFLSSRGLPSWIVGISLIATMLSALTYLSEPGEVWQSGATHMWGKILAVPFEMAFVWLICIPFLMRFRFTSAYEYLEHRFGKKARRLGTLLFICLALAWMGLIVLASSRALSQVSGIDLAIVIGVVGVVTTIYTTIGGNRAVILIDVVQVCLLICGAMLPVFYVALQTGTGPIEWFQACTAYRGRIERGNPAIPVATFDPFTRTSVMTVATHMFVWHICTHTANQMSVQRYFANPDLKSARRSFVVGSLLGVVINLLLLVVGLAVFYFYEGHLKRLPEGMSVGPDGGIVGRATDQIFPIFVVNHLPAGLSGAVFAAMLAAAMSTIGSGINALATVLAFRVGTSSKASERDASHMSEARGITVAIGLLITAAAYGLDGLTGDRNIVEMMPSSFNCFTGTLGGLFFIGMFIPRAREGAAVIATLCGLATSISIAYSKPLSALLGPSYALEKPISFTWVMPCSLLVTLTVALIGSRVSPWRPPQPGLTWISRRQPHESTAFGSGSR